MIIKAINNFNTDKPALDLDTPISIFISNRPSQEGFRKIVFACWQINNKRTNVFIKRELLIREGWSIDEMLKTDCRDIYKDSSGDEIVMLKECDNAYYRIRLITTKQRV